MSPRLEDVLDRCEATLRIIEDAVAARDWDAIGAVAVELPKVEAAELSSELEARMAELRERTLGLEQVVRRELDAAAASLDRTDLHRRAARAYLAAGDGGPQGP